jgi:hypothetical protein
MMKRRIAAPEKGKRRDRMVHIFFLAVFLALNGEMKESLSGSECEEEGVRDGGSSQRGERRATREILFFFDFFLVFFHHQLNRTPFFFVLFDLSCVCFRCFFFFFRWLLFWCVVKRSEQRLDGSGPKAGTDWFFFSSFRFRFRALRFGTQLCSILWR